MADLPVRPADAVGFLGVLLVGLGAMWTLVLLLREIHMAFGLWAGPVYLLLGVGIFLLAVGCSWAWNEARPQAARRYYELRQRVRRWRQQREQQAAQPGQEGGD